MGYNLAWRIDVNGTLSLSLLTVPTYYNPRNKHSQDERHIRNWITQVFLLHWPSSVLSSFMFCVCLQSTHPPSLGSCSPSLLSHKNSSTATTILEATTTTVARAVGHPMEVSFICSATSSKNKYFELDTPRGTVGEEPFLCSAMFPFISPFKVQMLFITFRLDVWLWARGGWGWEKVGGNVDKRESVTRSLPCHLQPRSQSQSTTITLQSQESSDRTGATECGQKFWTTLVLQYPSLHSILEPAFLSLHSSAHHPHSLPLIPYTYPYVKYTFKYPDFSAQ